MTALADLLGEDLHNDPWRDQALCAQADPEEFFPEKGGSTARAKAICRACPVAAECLQWALDHEERWGIWGGLSVKERARLTGPRLGPQHTAARARRQRVAELSAQGLSRAAVAHRLGVPVWQVAYDRAELDAGRAAS